MFERRPLTEREIQAARAIAAAVDVLQFAIFPLMFQGLLSPLNAAVDVLMALYFAARIGWHWALLPAFVSELIPFWDLAPTWTVAVFIATRGRDVIDTTAVEVEVVPEPAPKPLAPGSPRSEGGRPKSSARSR
jgi:hypothetical protein